MDFKTLGAAGIGDAGALREDLRLVDMAQSPGVKLACLKFLKTAGNAAVGFV